MSATTENSLLWSVVLAGGEGERTRSFIESWLGYHKPKQYCVFSGDRSLFQQTVDRADALTPSDRRVVVVASHHSNEARRQLRGRAPGVLLLQPANRGTAAGILLAIARVLAVDPSAFVVVYPSDHFVFPEGAFVETVGRAMDAARELRDRLMLLGVRAQGAEPDYGWIRQGAPLKTSGPVREVAAFVEKPSFQTSQALMARGALWNAMIVAGRAETFWELTTRRLPVLEPLFSVYRDAVGTADENDALQRIYEAMPSWDFSKDVLEPSRRELGVLPLEGVLWSDWGRPERILDTLAAIGAEPAFATT